MDIDELQKENKNLKVQRGYLIVLIVVLFITFTAIQYVILTESKNAISQSVTQIQSLNKLLLNERKADEKSFVYDDNLKSLNKPQCY